MTQSLRLRGARGILAAFMLSGFSVAAGCTEDSTDAAPEPDLMPDASTTRDSGKNNGNQQEDSSSPAADARSDARTNNDACADGGCEPKTGCAAHAEAAFCDDFDNADALEPNKRKWDFIEPTEQPVATLSTTRAISAPNSLLSRVIDGTTPGAKFAKTVTKANFTEATWAYDVYLDDVGPGGGFFLDDFQFTDDGGPDRFGFRIVILAAGGDLNEIKVEHNQDANGGGYIIEQPLTAGTVMRGKWHHFEQTVKFTFDDAGDLADGGTGNRVSYSLTIDKAATPAFKKDYAGITRAQAAFARIAGMALVFNKADSAGLKVHWDDHVLELK